MTSHRDTASFVMRVTATPVRARLVLAALLVLFGRAAFVTIPRPAPEGIPVPTVADSHLFETVVARVRSGENYYAVMGDELRHRYQPAASIFNWRLSAPYQIAAAAPDSIRSAMFLLLSALVFVLTALHLRQNRQEPIASVLALASQAGVLYAMWSARMMTETWSGLLIAISVLAYARSSWITGAAVGLLALFLRELAAPYCVICMMLAFAGRRRHELMLWIFGAAVFALLYGVHVTQVWAHQKPDDFISPPWIRFGGVRFILETIQQTNGWLVKLPAIASVLVLVLTASAPWAPRIPVHAGATVLAYGVFFFIVGQVFNDYWGFIAAPTAALALTYGYDGIRTLIDRSQLSRAS